MATQLSRPHADASVGHVARRNATKRTSVLVRADAPRGIVRMPDTSEDGSHPSDGSPRSSVFVVGATALLIVVASLLLIAAAVHVLPSLSERAGFLSWFGNPTVVIAIAAGVIALQAAVIA